jgi:hypothetical protein
LPSGHSGSFCSPTRRCSDRTRLARTLLCGRTEGTSWCGRNSRSGYRSGVRSQRNSARCSRVRYPGPDGCGPPGLQRQLRRCHQSDLSGQNDALPLAGRSFMGARSKRTIGRSLRPKNLIPALSLSRLSDPAWRIFLEWRLRRSRGCQSAHNARRWQTRALSLPKTRSDNIGGASRRGWPPR